MFTITPAAPADIPAAATVLAEAFEHDTVMASLTSGSGRPRARLTELFGALMRSGSLHAGRIDLARRDEDGAVLGAAIWELPNRRTSLLQQLAELPTFACALGWRGLRAATRLQSRLAAYRPVEPHWYLAQIGVGAEARGAGVGSALIRSRLQVIDSAGLPAYLESSNERNRALYSRMGFAAIATVTGIPDASPTAMWRAPAVAAPVPV
ncbi:GNAT family N-acetyltransferase [Isoptericola croceus]|uniref:GNAT family N-acetyltransferase n=1 Tax=Isoptericola croceus TaxID=3031406 RepID=UPI0023F7BF49|nr:GNAT family N-acetyltransferase [Isoptericola croceus]